MKSSSKPKRRYFSARYRPGIDDAEKITLAKNPETKLATLLQLQGSKNPEITRLLASNSVLPLKKRFAMVIKYLDYPVKDVQYSKKFQMIEDIRKEDLDDNQIAIIAQRRKLGQKAYSISLMNSFNPKVPELQKTLDAQYSETVKQLKTLDIEIPATFSKKLKRPWITTLTYAVHYGSERTFLRSENFKSKNMEWLRALSGNHPILEVENLNVESILDLQTPLFQQASLVLLVTHNFGVVTELIDSVKELTDVYLSKYGEQERLKAEKARLALEKIQNISAEKAKQKQGHIVARAQETLAAFKADALKDINSQLFLESRDSKGNLDNGFSWGISQKRIFGVYHSKVNSRINFASREIRGELISMFDRDVTHSEFQEFIATLDCKDYRGNLRRYSAFPREFFEDQNVSLEDAQPLYDRWSQTYPKSVLSAGRGHVPENIYSFLGGWGQISSLFSEHAIFFCKSVGLLCHFEDFDVAIHIAFVASKPTSDGLRGQWLIVVSGLAKDYSRDLQVMGWKDLFDTTYQHQEKIAPLRDSANTFWLYQTTDSQRAMGEVGKLIEGLLFEKYGLTSYGSSSHVKEVSPEARRQRREILDLIFRIRRYRESRRFRPYQGYCANPECGLPLSDPLSLARGFGPTCWEKMFREGVRHRDLATDYDRLYYETPTSLLDWQESFVSFFEQQSLI